MNEPMATPLAGWLLTAVVAICSPAFLSCDSHEPAATPTPTMTAAPTLTPTARPTPTVTPVPSITFKEAYELAVERAKQWQPDAYLWGADSGGGGLVFYLADAAIYDEEGVCCSVWHFFFYSPAEGQRLEVGVEPYHVSYGNTNQEPLPTGFTPLEVIVDDSMPDSTALLETAEGSGGSAFKAQGNRLWSIRLTDQYPTTEPIWFVTYGPTGGLPECSPGLYIRLSAVDGSVLEVTESELCPNKGS